MVGTATPLMGGVAGDALVALAVAVGCLFGVCAPRAPFRRANLLARLSAHNLDAELARRQRRRGVLTTWIAVMAAFPMLGGAALPDRTAVSLTVQPMLVALAPVCTLSVSLLLLGAVTSGFRGAAGPPMVVAGYVLAGAAWIGQSNLASTMVGLVCAGLAVATAIGQRAQRH